MNQLIDESNEYNDTELNLEFVNLGDISAKLLADEFRNDKLKKLTTLILEACNIGEEGIKSIAKELYHLKSLEELNFTSNKFGSNGGIALANILSKLTSLKGLYIDENNLGLYASIAIVNEIKHLHQLYTINLSNNSIGDEGAKAIIDIYLSKNTRGKVINIARGHEISIKDLIELIMKIMHCKLKINSLWCPGETLLAMVGSLK